MYFEYRYVERTYLETKEYSSSRELVTTMIEIIDISEILSKREEEKEKTIEENK